MAANTFSFQKTDKKRILLSFLGVTGMGFFLSFLVLCNLGTDPCTFMNRSISSRIGMQFGNWQLLINCVMFLIVLFLDRKLIGKKLNLQPSEGSNRHKA